MSARLVRPVPVVRLKVGGNPWVATLGDAELERILLDASAGGERKLWTWIEADQAEPDAVFAQVYLDPTNPRHQLTVVDRTFAVVLYGDPTKALKCLPNALAKADAADRHPGRSNGELVSNANFCLGDGDFAWGDSAHYLGATSAGSGLRVNQDRELAQHTLQLAMDAVHGARDHWVRVRRDIGSQGWYNPENRPGSEYQLTLDADVWREASFI